MVIRVWRVTIEDRHDWVFDDLDVTMVFVRAEIACGAKAASIGSEWMEDSAYAILADKEDGA